MDEVFWREFFFGKLGQLGLRADGGEGHGLENGGFAGVFPEQDHADLVDVVHGFGQREFDAFEG